MIGTLSLENAYDGFGFTLTVSPHEVLGSVERDPETRRVNPLVPCAFLWHCATSSLPLAPRVRWSAIGVRRRGRRR